MAKASYDRVMRHLAVHGYNESALSEITSRYGGHVNVYDDTCFPGAAFHGDHLGFFIVPVVEGWAILPYRAGSTDIGTGYEQINPADCRLLGKEDVAVIERAIRQYQDTAERLRHVAIQLAR